MNSLRTWLQRGAEFITAAMLAVIFLTFLLQIFTRYVSELAWMMPIPPIANWMASVEPLGWTLNFISFLWVWVVFFGCALMVREREHVTFDILYQGRGARGKTVFTLISGLILVGILILAFVPTWEAIVSNRLMILKKIPTLRLPFSGEKIENRWLFIPFILFMSLAILRYAWGMALTLLNGPPETELDEVAKANEDANL